MNKKLLNIKNNLENPQYVENAINYIVDDFMFAVERENVIDFSGISMANNKTEKKFFRLIMLNEKEKKFVKNILQDKENMTISEIAEKYHVNDQKVRYWLKKYGG